MAPDVAAHHNNLGNVLSAQGRQAEALAAYERSLGLNPDDPQTLNNAGTVLRLVGHLDAAEARLRRSLALRPGIAAVHSNLGNVLMDQGRVAEAVESFRHALSLDPAYAIAHNNLGNGLKRLGRYGEAIAAYRQAADLSPRYADALSNIAEALKECGQVDAALPFYDRAVEAAPDRLGILSNRLFALNCLSGLDRQDVLAEHRAWGARCMGRVTREVANPGDPAAGAPLRVGYLSADFRRHSVAYFVEPVFANHDPRAVEVFAYSNVAQPDAVTDRLKARAAGWRDVRGLDDGTVAERVRQDGIHILVDLGGHTADSRLSVLAQRPAPVQITWLGYPNTSGLDAVDVRLTDVVADPLGAEAWHTERLVRLEGGFLCYGPPDDAPDVGPPPCGQDQPVTFGSFNNLAKLSDPLVAAWSAILDAVPASRLLLKAKALGDAAARRAVLARFAARGTDAGRIEFRDWITEGSPLALYRSVDVGLDTFPYNGTTTTCEALWMGVPVVTWAGDRHASRVGASLLGRLGLEDLVADDAAGYVAAAVRLAVDRPRLESLRHCMRDRMAESGLTDGAAFTGCLEAVYRDLWRTRGYSSPSG